MKMTKLFAACAAAFLLLGSGYAYAAASSSEVVADQQQIQVTGTVVDAQGVPVPGASVIIKGTATGTMTDANGKFTIAARAGATLEVSCIGYATVDVAAKENVRVVLQEDQEFLDEVVVVGYGTQKKANLTGAVSTVDVAKTLESKSVANLSKALQGAVPGLTILNNNGKVGSDPSIVIRGIGTLSNSGTSTPLYVVDGVPIDSINDLNMADVQSISVLKDAASASIYGTRAAFGVSLITTKSAQTSEKVSVSYSNNFGWSQATMMPKYPTTIMEEITPFQEASNRNSAIDKDIFGTNLSDPDVVAAFQAWEKKHGTTLSGYRDMVEGDDYIRGLGYFARWDKEGIMFNRAAPSQNHTLAVQGTVGRTNYYLSMGYDREQGLLNFNPDILQKYNATVNVSSQITNWLQVGARVNYMYRDYEDPEDALRRGVYGYLMRWPTFFEPLGTIDGIDGRNVINYLKNAGECYTKNQNLRLGGFFKINIVKGLTLNGDFTYLSKIYRYKQSNLPVSGMNFWSISPAYATFSSTSFITQTHSFTNGYSANIYANYAITLGKNHNINVMAGFNADQSDYEKLQVRNDDMLDYNLQELALTPTLKNNSHAHSQLASAGFFGRINYNYKERIFLELNGRYDGSSKFNPGASQWAFFPSASAGWRISEEEFFKPLKKVVNNAKIRASYGVVGNQEVGSNMYLATMSRSVASVNWLGNGSSKLDTFSDPKMVSSSLTWESIATTNVGVDMGFLNGEINVSFDWFQRDTRNMLAPGKTLPSALGASAAYENAGSLRSRGWELSVDWHHRFGEVDVYAIGNLSDYKTYVTEWNNDTFLLNSNYSGKRYGDIYGFETDRYFTPEDFTGQDADGNWIPKAGVASQKGLQTSNFKYGPGDIKFVDQNGDGVIDGGKGTVEDHGDLIVIGNTEPRYQYGLRLGGSWKGFDLDMYIQGVGKRNIWTVSNMVMPFMRDIDAIYAHQLNYISTADAMSGNIDQSADFPRIEARNADHGTVSVIGDGCKNFYPQTRYVVNMAYMRMKNITIGYTIPARITQKIKVNRVRVYASVNNAFDIINHNKGTGIDPEMNKGNGVLWGRTDPMMRTWSCGFQLTF